MTATTTAPTPSGAGAAAARQLPPPLVGTLLLLAAASVASSLGGSSLFAATAPRGGARADAWFSPMALLGGGVPLAGSADAAAAAANVAAWAGVTPEHPVCVATMANAAYFHRLVETVAELRHYGRWEGEVLVLPAPDVPADAMRALAAAFPPLSFRYAPLVDTRNLSAWHAAHPFRTTDGRERSKTFQWHKFRLFEPWVGRACGRVLFLDAGMHIYHPLAPLWERLDPLVPHRLIAHSDRYMAWWWFTLGLQFEAAVCPSCYAELNATPGVDLGGDYFQTGLLYWDTRITRPWTYAELSGLMERFPMSRTNEQGIMNVWAARHGTWVPLPTDCAPHWCLYDITPRHFHAFPGRYIMSKKLPSGYVGPLAVPPVHLYPQPLADAVRAVSGVALPDPAAAAAAAAAGGDAAAAAAMASSGAGGAASADGSTTLALDLSACPRSLAVPDDGSPVPAVRPLWLVQTHPDAGSSFVLGFLAHWAYRCRIPLTVWHSRGPHHWAAWWRRAVNAAGERDAREAAGGAVPPPASPSPAPVADAGEDEEDADSAGGSGDVYTGEEADADVGTTTAAGAGRQRQLQAAPTPTSPRRRRRALRAGIDLRWYNPAKFAAALREALAATAAGKARRGTGQARQPVPPTLVYLTLNDLPFAKPGAAALAPWFAPLAAQARVVALVHSAAHLASRRLALRKGVPLGVPGADPVRLLPLMPSGAAGGGGGGGSSPALLPVWLLRQTRSGGPAAGPVTAFREEQLRIAAASVRLGDEEGEEGQGFAGDAELPELPWLPLPQRRRSVCFVGRNTFDGAHTDQAALAALLQFHSRYEFSFLPLQNSDGGGGSGRGGGSELRWADVVSGAGGQPAVQRVAGDQNAAAEPADGTVDESVARSLSSPALAVVGAQRGARPLRFHVRGARQQEADALFDRARRCAFIAVLLTPTSPLGRSALHLAVPLALSARTPLLMTTAAARGYGFATAGGGDGLGGALVADSLAEASRVLDRVTAEQYDGLLAGLEAARLSVINANWAALHEALGGDDDTDGGGGSG